MRKPYTDVAKRILAAVRELNAVLVEAHEHPQVRVHMRLPKYETIPSQFGCEVTRITKHAIPAEHDEIKTSPPSQQLASKFVWKMASPTKGKKSKKPKKAKKSPVRKAA